jgi:hypothetical protein
VPAWFPKQAIKHLTCYQNLFGFQSRQSSNHLATGTCWVSKAGNQAINLPPVLGFQGICNQAINLLPEPVWFPKHAINTTNLPPVPVWFPKQAIKQSTCYRYLYGFQGRQSSNQLATGTCLVSKAGNQTMNLLPVSVWFPKQAIKQSVWFLKQAITQSTCYRHLFGFQGWKSSNQLATGTF